MKLQNFKEKFNPILAAHVKKLMEECRLNLRNDELFAHIQHAETLINRDAKRLRPYLMVLSYIAFGGSLTADIYKVGIILELFHNYALIHDDIVDRGENRNGIITLHRYIEGKLKKKGSTDDIKRISEGETIFIGDLILSWSEHLWDELKTISPQRKARAKSFFRTITEKAMLGEILDIDLTAQKGATMEQILKKTELKTSGYTVVGPMQIGAALASADRSALIFAENFGTMLGIAFQIQDDLFDLIVAPGVEDKAAFSDMRNRQQTIFTQFIFDKGSKKNQGELLTLLGKNLTPKDYDRVLHLFKSSGALAYGIQQMDFYFEEALKILDASRLQKKYKDELKGLVTTIRTRTS